MSETACPAVGCPGPRRRAMRGPGAADALAATPTSPALRAATRLLLRVPMYFQTRRWDHLLQRFFASGPTRSDTRPDVGDGPPAPPRDSRAARRGPGDPL